MQEEKYIRVTRTIWEEIKASEAKWGDRREIHAHDAEPVPIPLGHLRVLEDLVEYLESVQPMLDNYIRARMVFNPKAGSVSTDEGAVAYNIWEGLQYVHYLSQKTAEMKNISEAAKAK